MNEQMNAVVYKKNGQFVLEKRPVPAILNPTDAIVKVTLTSICSSDIHIKHGSVPKAKPGIIVGHEMVGEIAALGRDVKGFSIKDRVTVNVETFCGHCFFCERGFVNNCTDQDGGWALGCRIDGGQCEYVRVPYAENGLNHIPDGVSDEQAIFTGDILSTGFWGAKISEIHANKRFSQAISCPPVSGEQKSVKSTLAIQWQSSVPVPPDSALCFAVASIIRHILSPLIPIRSVLPWPKEKEWPISP